MLKDLRFDVELKFSELQDFIDGKPSAYGTSDAMISTAYKALRVASLVGTDVSDLEAQMPTLVRQLKRRYAESKVSELQSFIDGKPSAYDTSIYLVGSVRNALEAAMAVDVNVSDLKARMPNLVHQAEAKDKERLEYYQKKKGL